MKSKRIGMKRFGAVFSFVLFLVAACQDGGANSVSMITDSRNVVYSVGDVIFYRVESLQSCAGGNYYIRGWFEIDVLDEGKKNPFTGNSVLTLVEKQAYGVMLIGSRTGVSQVSTIGGVVSRYFTQNAETGTILYWGDSFPKPDGSGSTTVWFKEPYIPIDSPYRVGQEQQVRYDRYSEVAGKLEYLDTLGSKVIVEQVETVETDLGRFEAYKMAWYDAQGVFVRSQYLYPALGIVKFIFSPLAGCSGDMKMFISYTNIPNCMVSAQPVSGPPAVGEGGVVNSASYTIAGTTVAPGSMAAVFGTNLTDGASCTRYEGGRLITSLGGASVTVNGIPVPLFYATPNQIGIQVPTELTGTTASIVVTVGGQSSAPRTFSVEPFLPGIFTFSQDGRGAGAITHGGAVETPVSPQNPAQPNEVVSIYTTGLGQVTPALPTGALPSGLTETVTKPTVTVDGIPAEVLFSGLSGCCVGLNQINVRLPGSTRSGNDIPVRLTIGGKPSNSVTIAVVPEVPTGSQTTP